ncbi:MAG TPA: aminotransferase class I/II-fold pyridoxal phosphate-dependent enzyme [Burkholderiaceae bacterium]
MKHTVADLAILGGAPLFGDKVHVGRPNIGDRAFFFSKLESILDSKWLTNNGACVQQLEREVAQYLQVKHAIAVCNATVGLEIAIRALDLEGEVIVPSLTFVASAHALQWQRIAPVFCDVDEQSHLIDPSCIETLITPRTTGIMGVHLWGRVCDVERLSAIAERHKLALLFDAAHAFGCSRQGRMVGGFGRAEVFSFHATKFFNSFEGGAITTNDDDLAARLRLMINFGFAGYDNVVHIGTNGKMNEVCAAMGLASMRSMAEVVERNRRNHAAYAKELADVPGMRLLQYPATEKGNYQYIVVEYQAPAGCLSRDQLIDVLWAENVIARRYFHPGCHRMEPYRTLFPNAGHRLPATEAITDRLVVLPTGADITATEIAAITGVMRTAVRGGAELAAALQARH